ncbi:glycosyltransferase family 20 protein [Ramaria rubella]|nr:glycosyltransferase family 20 protein [Ramaria rubella]
MSSFRDHRVIIASLFLPTTAALSSDHSESSSEISFVSEKPATTPLLSPMPASPKTKSRISSTPLKSIVDDLTVKSKASTPSVTPRTEGLNPFAKSLGSALSSLKERDTVAPLPLSASKAKGNHHQQHSPQSQHQHQALHQRETPPRLLSRRSSRSASLRRSHSRPETPAPSWHLEPNPQGNGGLYNAVASVSNSHLKRKLWVGTLGTATDGFDASVRKGVDARLRDECDSVNVWIDDDEFTGCYDVFCHQVLWPCLHYAIPDAPKTKVFYESGSYAQVPGPQAYYEACNRKFADAIIRNYQEGDIVWVNDYHLMLVPYLVRAALPSATIGFFLHVAFPSSEIFRCLAVREQLLYGLLAADLIGFQTANFARHFRQTVSRILSLEAVPKGITTREGKFVDVAVFPMGIDVRTLNIKRKEPEVGEWVQLLKMRYAGMKLIVGRDKLDEVQGVRHKLLAFEAFLSRFPEFQGEVVLIQVALSTTEENELQGGVSDLVSRINSRFSSLTYQPVVFLHTQDLTFSQYLALLTVADAFIVTSLREDMWNAKRAAQDHSF